MGRYKSVANRMVSRYLNILPPPIHNRPVIYSIFYLTRISVVSPIPHHVCQRSDSRRTLILRESPTVMQPNFNEPGAQAGNGLSLPLQPELPTRTLATGGSDTLGTG